MAVQAATLEYMSLEDMVRKSSAVVRVRVGSSYAARSLGLIYTHYRIEVLEGYKAGGAAALDVVLPGGSANGLRQTFPGTPRLTEGQEYLLFLWKSPSSGLTHVIGLSQGVFDIRRGESGEAVAFRGPTSELMLDSRGQMVRDAGLTLRLRDFRQRVAGILAQKGAGR
jgi:hypothetical protein